MSNSQYVEDVSIEGRQQEIEIKVGRIVRMLEKEGLDGLYLSKQSNFAWITAGSSNIVTMCTESGVASVLVTRSGERYAITDAVEEPRMKEEQLLEELGFKVLSQAWYEQKNQEFVANIVGSLEKVGSDVPFGAARVIPEKINPLRFSLTFNEICRYQFLGDHMSKSLETYLTTIKPGMSEYEIAGGVANAIWPDGIDQVLFLVASDERILKHRHATPTDKKVKKSVMVSCNGRYKGLITTTTRMVHFGQPPEGLLEQFRVTAEVENRMIEATKPGVDDLVAHMVGKQAYADFGYAEMYFKHHQGGPQGYYNRNYLVSEAMHGIVQVNQGYCYNPVIDGTKVEDAFIATENGPLMITKPVVFPTITSTVNDVTFVRPNMLVLD